MQNPSNRITGNFASSVDNVVRMAIEDLFPDQTIPDEDNYLPEGGQYKAPDHAILDEKVLIERKSRNPEGGSQLYERLVAIAKEQGAPFRAYGRFNIEQVISSLPDPADANRRLVDYLLSQTMKSIRAAKRKFETYDGIKGKAGQIKLLIVADNSDYLESTASIEQFIGRKMGGYDRTRDETGIIDAVFFVKHPELTMDEADSYWFKAIVKRTLPEADRELVGKLAAALHHRIGHYEPFYLAAQRFKIGRLRMLTA